MKLVEEVRPNLDVPVVNTGESVEYASFEDALRAERMRMIGSRATSETVSGPQDSPERPTNKTFYDKNLSELDKIEASNADWLNSSERLAYEQIGREINDQPMTAHQADVLRFLRTRARSDFAKNSFDSANYDTKQTLRELIMESKAQLDAADDNDTKKALSDGLRNMVATYKRLVGGDKVKQPDTDALKTYADLARIGEDKDAINSAKKDMLFTAYCLRQDEITYNILAAKYPRQEQDVDAEAVRKARVSRGLSSRALASVYADRQKKVGWFDRQSNSSLSRKRSKFITQKSEYEDQVMAEIRTKLEGMKFTSEDSLNQFIATQASLIGNELTDNIEIDYARNNSKISRVMDFMAGRNEKGEVEKSLKKRIGRIALHGAAGFGLLVGSVATGGSLLAATAAGAYAGTNIYAHWESRAKNKRLKRGRKDILRDELKSRLDLLNDLDDQSKNTLDGRLERAAKFITNQVEHDTAKQQSARFGRVAVSAAGGMAISLGSHMIGNWIGGPDSASNINVNSAPHEAVLPNTVPAAPVQEIHTGVSNIFAHSNMGWYEAMQQMGIDPASRHDVLLRAAPSLVKNNLAYTMSNGLPGIPSTGMIPQAAIDIIRAAAA